MTTWLSNQRPASFWFAGLFNKEGFLNAIKQESRQVNKTDLLRIIFKTKVLKEVVGGENGRIKDSDIKAPEEGVYIHGLFLEGAGWNTDSNTLENSKPNHLYTQFPVLHLIPF